MLDIEVFLPFPPTVNSYYSQNKFTKYVSRKGKLYSESVAKSIHEQGFSGFGLSEQISVIVILYPPDRRKRDLDNYLKALLDACTRAGLWEDDSLIDQLVVKRGPLSRGGLATLRVQPAAPLEALPSFLGAERINA